MNNIVTSCTASQNYRQITFKGDISKKIVRQIGQQPNKPVKNNGISSKVFNFYTEHFAKPKNMLEIGSGKTPVCSSARSFKSWLLSLKANLSIFK